MDEEGMTVRARIRTVGWMTFRNVKQYTISNDGYIRIQKMDGHNVVLNPEDVIVIGLAEDFD